MNPLNINIGRRIAQLRHEQNMTQSQLAEALDISVKHCSEVERGLACLSLEKLAYVCDILPTTLDFLVFGTDNRTERERQIPAFIIDLFNSEDERQKELFKQYMLMFKKLIEFDEGK